MNIIKKRITILDNSKVAREKENGSGLLGARMNSKKFRRKCVYVLGLMLSSSRRVVVSANCLCSSMLLRLYFQFYNPSFISFLKNSIVKIERLVDILLDLLAVIFGNYLLKTRYNDDSIYIPSSKSDLYFLLL